MLRMVLLICGVVSSLLYVGADLLAAVRYPDYHGFTSQAISELTAVGAPTKGLVEPLFIVYDILIIAFGVGVWRSAGRKRALRVVGGLLVGIGAVGLVAMPFTPMNLRGTGNLSTDAPHIVVTGVIVLFILSAIGFGASLVGRRFRPLLVRDAGDASHLRGLVGLRGRPSRRAAAYAVARGRGTYPCRRLPALGVGAGGRPPAIGSYFPPASRRRVGQADVDEVSDAGDDGGDQDSIC